jgi:ubiquinone/menaquinone biosynthesis C-methylase UbiE
MSGALGYDNDALEQFYKSPTIGTLSSAEQCAVRSAGFIQHSTFVKHTIDRLHFYQRSAETECLDVGCNSGLFTSSLQKYFPNVVGIDYSEPLIIAARSSYPTIDFRVADARTLPFESRSFGLVSCFFLIHYLKDWQAITLECLRLVEPGGIVALQFTRALPMWQIVLRGTAAILTKRRSLRRGVQYIRQRWIKAVDGRSRWLAGIDRPVEQVQDLLLSQGFEIVEMHLPRRFSVFDEDLASIIARRSFTGKPFENPRLVCRSCLAC